jgi:hypothetical protein
VKQCAGIVAPPTALAASARLYESAGGCAILPRGIPHGFRNVSEAPGRFVCVVTPGGLEEYFLEIARCSPPPSPAQLVSMARTYGLTLFPPGA